MRRSRSSGFDSVGLVSGAMLGTAVMTAVMETAQARGMTRISLPYILGTMVGRRRAVVRTSGIALHFVNGAIFASGYALLFTRARRADWRIGAALGLLHGAVVLVAALPVLQEIHPRMADEDEGPDPTPMLQPPGFLGLNYGVQTPAVTLAAHAVYGGIVGALYRVRGRD
jgi:hypothetical protein